MTTVRELYHQIGDIEHPGYELKSWYGTWTYANDHMSFNVILKENGVPVDCLNIPCRGNKFKVRGYWKSFKEAKEYACQVLGKWF